MAKVVALPFSFTLDHLGYWRKPQAVWASTVMPEPLLSLVDAVRDAAARGGIQGEERSFRTHLTLLRKVGKPLRDMPAMMPISWRVDSFVLAESVAVAGGVRYEVRRVWPLSAGAADSTSG